MPYVPETVKKRQPIPRRYGGRRLDEFGNPLPTGGLLGGGMYTTPLPPSPPPVGQYEQMTEYLGQPALGAIPGGALPSPPTTAMAPVLPDWQALNPPMGGIAGQLGQPTAPYSGLLQSNYNLGYEELARQRGLAGVRSRRPLTGYGAI